MNYLPVQYSENLFLNKKNNKYCNFLINMDYSEKVKKEQYKNDINFFLARPKIGVQEARLGYADAQLPFVYVLTVVNSCLILNKCGWKNNKFSFLAVALTSYPIALAVSKYAFGYDKYRTVARRDEDTRNSVKYYLENADLKN